MADLLDLDYINSLPQPLWDGDWPVYDIEVSSGLYRIDVCGRLQYQYIPSRAWHQGGPLVEAHRISLTERGNGQWAADVLAGWVMEADTPLLAAMRVLVARKLGDTVRM